MFRKSKGVDFMQEYEELLKETDAMRRKLGVAKRRKLILSSEVGFLRRKYKHLVNTKSTSSLQELPMPELKQIASSNEHIPNRKENARRHRLPVAVPHKKQNCGKQVAIHNTSPVTVLARKNGKESTGYSVFSSSDTKRKNRMLPTKEANDKAFDLNRFNTPNSKDAPLPTRAPLFDLNEISTGDEDWQPNVEASNFEEAMRCSMRGMGDEQQHDLSISICRNAGEGSSRSSVKRKISWQDPVALRV